jgi:hypothetical protein
VREVEVLALLRRVAGEDPGAVRRLMGLGADRFLRDLRGTSGTHLSETIDALLELLLKSSSEENAAGEEAATAAKAWSKTSKTKNRDTAKEHAAAATASPAYPRSASASLGRATGSIRSSFPADLAATAPASARPPPEETSSASFNDEATRDMFLRDPRLAASYWRISRAQDAAGHHPAHRAAALATALDQDTHPRSATNGGQGLTLVHLSAQLEPCQPQ